MSGSEQRFRSFLKKKDRRNKSVLLVGRYRCGLHNMYKDQWWQYLARHPEWSADHIEADKVLKRKYDINNGLPHNSIIRSFSLRCQRICSNWSDRLYRIDTDSGIFASMHQCMEYSWIRSLHWPATVKEQSGQLRLGNGVFECYRDSVRLLSTTDGLLSTHLQHICRQGR